MPYSAFHKAFPDIARSETRTVTVLQPLKGLPPAEYAFLEMYCDERGCDCRRVFLHVISPGAKGTLAVIAYGWESRDYYVRWMGDADPAWIDSLKGPALNLASPQSDLAVPLLELFRKYLLPDKEYIDRIKRHYSLFRGKIDRSRRARRPPKVLGPRRL